MVKTDAGKYYVFPLLRTLEADLPPVYTGPIVRKDWLNDLGLTTPTTIQEWEVMLKAFKEKKNAESPFTAYTFSSGGLMKTSAMFASAYGVMDDFFVKDGKVIYGPIQSGFKEYLTLMNKWYKDGLIDKDIFTMDQKTADAKMLSGKSGSLVGNLGGNMGKYLDAMRAKDPKYDLVGVPYPTLKKGDKPMFGQLAYIYGDSNGSSAITAASKNKELAAQYLDYAYSKEGQLLYNFGIEGTSYDMVNGVPTYSEQMTKNPKLTFSQAVTGYTSTNSSVVLHPEFFKQFSLPLSQQEEAMDNWKNTDMKKYQIPPITATKEESSDLAAIMNDVESYKQEMAAKFILGTEPLTNFDKFVEQIKKLGIDKAVKIKEAAIERYNKR
jgi:putative aldouronate transport system substrate-binding protein